MAHQALPDEHHGEPIPGLYFPRLSPWNEEWKSPVEPCPACPVADTL